jgi:hypothetical protein
LSKSLNARRKSSRAARKKLRIVPDQATCGLVFRTLSVTLPTQMFASSARNQVTTCSIVMPCHHFDQMLAPPMTHLICSARIAIPMDTAQPIVHTQWMFSNVCMFFAMLSSIQHNYCNATHIRPLSSHYVFSVACFGFGFYFTTLVILLLLAMESPCLQGLSIPGYHVPWSVRK